MLRTGFDFAAWQREQEQKYAETRARIFSVLEAGGIVTEHLGRLVKAWTLGNGPFLEPYNSDPDYLADHLLCRHRGFGTRLEFS